MIRNFVWYLHETGESEEVREELEEGLGGPISDELFEKIGRPFYEVELSCTLDTETGKVEIKKARST